MQYAPPQKVITCILPKGKAMPLVRLLVSERGLTMVDVQFARGVGRLTPLHERGVGETSEREILTVAVADEQADEVFEYIYFTAGIDQPHGGLMFMHALALGTSFVLPELAEEG